MFYNVETGNTFTWVSSVVFFTWLRSSMILCVYRLFRLLLLQLHSSLDWDQVWCWFIQNCLKSGLFFAYLLEIRLKLSFCCLPAWDQVKANLFCLPAWDRVQDVSNSCLLEIRLKMFLVLTSLKGGCCYSCGWFISVAFILGYLILFRLWCWLYTCLRSGCTLLFVVYLIEIRLHLWLLLTDWDQCCYQVEAFHISTYLRAGWWFQFFVPLVIKELFFGLYCVLFSTWLLPCNL